MTTDSSGLYKDVSSLDGDETQSTSHRNWDQDYNYDYESSSFESDTQSNSDAYNILMNKDDPKGTS